MSTPTQPTAEASAHTPGPWVVKDSHPDHCVYAIESLDPTSDRRAPMCAGIASISRYGEPDENGSYSDKDAYYRGKQYAEVHLANARLIAAAPELLAACQWFVSQCQGDSGTGESYWEEFAEYRAARATIEAATKGTQ